MSVPRVPQSLSEIETRWSLVLEAHRGEGEASISAQHALVEQYAGAVYRFLLASTHDPHEAADLTQELVLRFLRGEFHRADPSRGKFRFYLRTAARNLLREARRRQKTEPRQLPATGEPGTASTEDDLAQADRALNECLREEILSRAWQRLAAQEREGGVPLFTVLSHRAEQPRLRSHELAEHLSARLGTPVNAGWVRQNLHRARLRLADFIRAEVSLSLGPASAEDLAEELRSLGLWSYCNPDSR